MPAPLRLLAIGAHPDDVEYKAGGLVALYARRGHAVTMLSMTDGSAGHHAMRGPALAERRRAEAEAAARSAGASCAVWEYPDGRLEPTIEIRERLIRAIRRFRPDLVLIHRLCDYHPDHRAAAQLVQDASYLLGVPAICPDVPHLPRVPVIAYYSDEFAHPYPFQPQAVVDIAATWDAKVAMLDAHASQFYEWLPYNMGHADEVPADPNARRAWLSGRMEQLSRLLADRCREPLLARFGPGVGDVVDLVEAFEISEYGAPADAATIERLFLVAPP
jgi:LmbE family N-acetylglucosaminyl deacetylase